MNIITLISDFGTSSHYVAGVKGALYAKLEEVNVIDISHDILPWNLEQAIFMLNAVRNNFVGNVFHLIGVNNNATHHIAARVGNHWFLAADNGILPEVLKSDNAEYFSLGQFSHPSFMESFYPEMVKKIIDNKVPGIETPEIVPEKRLFKSPQQQGNRLKAFYVYFDRYGNAIVNLHKDEFYAFVGKDRYKIIVNQSDAIERISASYYQAVQGELIAVFNASGYLEISFTFGNAKQLFGFDKTQHLFIERY